MELKPKEAGLHVCGVLGLVYEMLDNPKTPKPHTFEQIFNFA